MSTSSPGKMSTSGLFLRARCSLESFFVSCFQPCISGCVHSLQIARVRSFVATVDERLIQRPSAPTRCVPARLLPAFLHVLNQVSPARSSSPCLSQFSWPATLSPKKKNTDFFHETFPVYFRSIMTESREITYEKMYASRRLPQ